MVSVPSAVVSVSRSLSHCPLPVRDGCRVGGRPWEPDSRQIGHGERGVTIEMLGFNEPLKKIPTHLARLIGTAMRRREAGGRVLKRCGGIKHPARVHLALPFTVRPSASSCNYQRNCSTSHPDIALTCHADTAHVRVYR